LLSVVLFVDVTKQVQGILLGAIVIVVLGVIDDILQLKAWIKLLGQIAAAVLAVCHGVVVEFVSHPVSLGGGETGTFLLGILSIPLTVIWIVGITNAVNLIDGLDGLAVGISTIGSITMLVVGLLVADTNVALLLAALAGGCLGFMPFNLNPARIFMGDTGALLLGFVLSTVSVVGFFKFYALISFIVPLLAMALPILDTVFAVVRRTLKGQSPMTPDRGHFHHRLLDMGLSQKQTVAVLYSISAVLGLAAVVIASNSETRAVLVVIAFVAAIAAGIFIRKEFHDAAAHQHAVAEVKTKSEEEKNDEMSGGAQ